MAWSVLFHPEFVAELETFSQTVQDRLAELIVALQERGPNLARPYVDTLEGSRYPNMKELRCPVGREVWRFAFAFDLKRQAIFLVGGNKQGKQEARFYRTLIKIADRRFGDWI